MIDMLFVAIAMTRAVPILDDVAMAMSVPVVTEQPAGVAAKPAPAAPAAPSAAAPTMTIRWKKSTEARPDDKVVRVSRPGGDVPAINAVVPSARVTSKGAIIVPSSTKDAGGGRVIVVNPTPVSLVPETRMVNGRPAVGERDQYGRLIIARADQVMRAFDKRFGIGVVGRFNNGNNPFPLFPNLPVVNIAPRPLDPSKLPSEQLRESVLTPAGRDPRELPSRQRRQAGANSPFATPQIDPTRLPSEQVRGAVLTPGGRDPRELPSRQQP